MNWRTILRLLGILLAFYSLGFVPSLAVSLYYGDGEAAHFAEAMALTAVAGIAVWAPFRRDRGELKVRDGFLVVTLFWAVLGLVGAIPFILGLHLDLTDAVFEAVSGFSTTGATVIVGLDQLPPSILYHRQQIQWLGGMGVVVLALAILPLLGVGGMQLYRAEASGITKDDKLTPRIANTARALWALYLGLTIACGFAYWLAGMTPFDAVGHAYATVATGGYSTHDASIAYFASPAIEVICIVFMLAGGVNFAIHFVAWRRRNPLAYFRDPETRIFVALYAVATLAVAAGLALTRSGTSGTAALRESAFQVASVMTSTGFTTADFSTWPSFLPLAMVILAFVGGCAGSTAGGIKVVRIALLAKMGIRQLAVLVHTRSVTLVKLGRRRVPEEVIYAVLGYYTLYIVTSLALALGFLAAGLDLVSAIGAVTASINLLGPGLGEVSSNFAGVSPTVKGLAVFGMLVGRLEVFPLLVLFTPTFWRH
ncbi:MAG: potassium transporter [Burkholderiales bacterium]|nr:potassium transporter [Burkholderiales bacterium]